MAKAQTETGTRTRIMAHEEQLAVNRETVERLRALQTEIDRQTIPQMEKLQAAATRTFHQVRGVIWFVVGVGVFLLTASMWLFVTQGRALEVLGVGSLGVADLVALFFFKPIDRLQKATADFAQQVMILKAWTSSVDLQLLAMDVNDPESLMATDKNLRGAAVQLAKALQETVG